MSAAIGMICLGAFVLVESAPLGFTSPSQIAGGLVFGGMALGIGWVAAIFVVAFYLCIFGLPIAVLLGDRIRHPLALGVSIVDACAGAGVATTGSKLGLLGGAGFSLTALMIALCFALPAGYFYRRNVIALRDQAEFV